MSRRSTSARKARPYFAGAGRDHRRRGAKAASGFRSVPLCVTLCVEIHTWEPNLSIDPDLVDRALEVSGERTKKAAVTKALQEFIARRRQKRLLDLMGKLEWDSSYDYKTKRARD